MAQVNYGSSADAVIAALTAQVATLSLATPKAYASPAAVVADGANLTVGQLIVVSS